MANFSLGSGMVSSAIRKLNNRRATFSMNTKIVEVSTKWREKWPWWRLLKMCKVFEHFSGRLNVGISPTRPLLPGRYAEHFTADTWHRGLKKDFDQVFKALYATYFLRFEKYFVCLRYLVPLKFP